MRSPVGTFAARSSGSSTTSSTPPSSTSGTLPIGEIGVRLLFPAIGVKKVLAPISTHFVVFVRSGQADIHDFWVSGNQTIFIRLAFHHFLRMRDDPHQLPRLGRLRQGGVDPLELRLVASQRADRAVGPETHLETGRVVGKLPDGADGSVVGGSE